MTMEIGVLRRTPAGASRTSACPVDGSRKGCAAARANSSTTPTGGGRGSAEGVGRESRRTSRETPRHASPHGMPFEGHSERRVERSGVSVCRKACARIDRHEVRKSLHERRGALSTKMSLTMGRLHAHLVRPAKTSGAGDRLLGQPIPLKKRLSSSGVPKRVCEGCTSFAGDGFVWRPRGPRFEDAHGNLHRRWKRSEWMC
ncbi:hypothetical protein BC628DRAFT_1376020 [Trametes gibbosa]|nr:hypothetical protein BC628DRAFT_1376020 [Trametes gibbosa]